MTSQFDWRANGEEYDLRWADGSPSTIDIRVQNAAGAWGTGSPDPMFHVYLYPESGGNIGVQLEQVPPGVYDLYCYAHGARDEENTVIQVQVGTEPQGQKETLDGPG